MSAELLQALVVFAFTMSITPGPNNLMLMASGANFGLLRTVPHALGVGSGFVIMAIVVGAGLSRVFEAFPATQIALKVASVCFMLFLAYKIATAAPPKDGEARSTPISFIQAVLFQWMNPKAIIMAVSAMSLYAPDGSFRSVVLVALVFGAVNLPSVSCWALVGVQLRRILSNPARMRVFNGVMAVLLLASLYPVVTAEF
ncbi:LysE family translocator [Halocynthiibacter sp. C4]|uniref:LysE family translocator n=1 Tax=Halocynthiibacter sp. C4 TaxID=2992758 RepID=UPI00237A2A1C|nr:LysE family translocator [Halocynthiibacter sp. C4]MDE0590141.1 LysE family translocator [Halocynthiibacter sp. C4]